MFRILPYLLLVLVTAGAARYSGSPEEWLPRTRARSGPEWSLARGIVLDLDPAGPRLRAASAEPGGSLLTGPVGVQFSPALGLSESIQLKEVSMDFGKQVLLVGPRGEWRPDGLRLEAAVLTIHGVRALLAPVLQIALEGEGVKGNPILRGQGLCVLHPDDEQETVLDLEGRLADLVERLRRR